MLSKLGINVMLSTTKKFGEFDLHAALSAELRIC